MADKTTTSALSEKEAQSLLERMVFLQFQGKFDEAADVNQMLYEGGWVVMIHRYLERRTDRHGPLSENTAKQSSHDVDRANLLISI